jgi:transcriptional regulator with XRE-family HTH domain
MQIEQAFGNALREMRHQQELSQEDLADLSSLHRTYISQLERGLKSPTLSTIWRLSDALHICPHKLVRRVESIMHNTGGKNEISQAGNSYRS